MCHSPGDALTLRILTFPHHLDELVNVNLPVPVNVNLGHHFVCSLGWICTIGDHSFPVLLHHFNGSDHFLLLQIAVIVDINNTECLPRDLNHMVFPVKCILRGPTSIEFNFIVV
jgi:hypothetical protein